MTMHRNARLVLAATIAVLASVAALAQPITDLIPPVNLRAGRTDSIVVSDLFYAVSYDVRFKPQEHIGISYDGRKNIVVLRPKEGFAGATVVEFTLGGIEYAFPVCVRTDRSDKVQHLFRFTPSGRPGRVTLTGSFNNWNKTSHELRDAKGTGTYELAVPLDPGSYLYKFVVDGKELVDPLNPERSPTGFDDFNSILRVPDPDSSKLFLHIGGRTETPSEVSLSLVCEHPWGEGTLAVGDILALMDNRKIDSGRVHIAGNRIELRFPKNELAGERVVRVLVAHAGTFTNLQQIVLRGGAPAGGPHQASTWTDGIVYSILVDRFNDGDRSNDIPVVHDSLFVQANYQGGDFRGIINKIEDGYLDSLGVNILWISPVYDNPDIAFKEYPPPHRWYSGYHGYWPISDTLVEEKFGTMAELQELVSKAHHHHMRVLLDFVAHHVHIDHPFYKQHPEWFGALNLPDGRKNLRLWDEFRLSTWFEPYMPSFDFTKSPEAITVVAANAVWWLTTTGADGFRHDAVKHVPNVFWRELTRRLKAEIEVPLHRKVYQIGETFGDDDLISSYVNNGQLNAQFNFNLSYLTIPVFLEPDKSFTTLDYYIKRSFSAYGPYNLMGNIMDSHDKVRYMAYADGKVKNQGEDTREMAWNHPPTVDHPSSYRKAELYLTYLLTTPGLPVIYYGSEFGMTGADDPDNRRMMRFGDNLTGPEKEMLGVTCTVTNLRNEHPALRYGDFLTVKADDAVYAYLRSDLNERLLVVLNKSEKLQERTLQLPAAYRTTRLVDVLTGVVIPVTDRATTVAIPAIGWRVLKVQ